MRHISHGADVERLDDIAVALRRQGDKVTDAGDRGANLVERLRALWDGPDFERFAKDWRAAHRQLDDAESAMRTFSRKLVAEGEADDLVTQAQERLEDFTPAYEQHVLDNFRIKLGLVRDVAGDNALVEDLLQIATDESLDFTGLFRDLARVLRDEPTPTLDRVRDVARWQAWRDRWLTRLHGEGKAPAASAQIMDETNPVHIPRNHLVEEALAAAHAGNLAPFEQLLEVLRSPFVEQPGLERYAGPADPDFTRGYITYCGT